MSDTPILDQYLNANNQQGDQVSDTTQNEAPAGTTPADQPVNVMNPSGDLVSVPQSQIDSMNLYKHGYSPATSEAIEDAKLQRDYGGPLNQVNAAIRGAEKIIPGLGPTLERGLSYLPGMPEYNPEEVSKTEEANPISSMAGMMTTLVGSGIAGPLERGAAALINPIAEKAAPYLPNIITKVGSTAAKAAIENMLVTSADETNKLISGDPKQNIDTALANIKFSGLFGAGIGGAFGVVSPLWNTVSGGKISQILEHFSDRLNGLSGKLPDPIIEAAEKAGIVVPPEVKAGISGDLASQKSFQALAQSDTHAGEVLQKSVGDLRTQIPNKIVEALGKTPEQIDALENLSTYESGKNVQDTFVKEFKEYAGPASQAFEDIKSKFAGAPLSQDVNKQLSEQIASYAQEQGFAKNPSGPQNKFIQNILEELPLQKTAKDLRNYISNIGKQTFGYDNPLSQAGYEVKKILGLGEEEAVARKFTSTYPERMNELADAKASYSAVKDDIERISDRLHPGAAGGPGSFARAVADMDKPETILNRLSNLKDVNLQKLLAEKFPQTSAQIKDYQLNQLLKSATKRMAPGEMINPVSFFKAIDNLSPEMRASLIPAESAAKLDGARTLLESLNAIPRNTSNTSTISQLMNKYRDSGVVGMISMLTGHGPVTSIIVGALTKLIGRDIPDAARLGLLKFLGSSEKIDAPAFKSMVDFIHNTSKGEKLVSGAVRDLFKAGREVIPQAFEADEKRNNLEKKLLEIQENPNILFNTGGSLGHYMPEHQTALTQTAASVSQYLNSIRPTSSKMNPLDSESKPSADKISEYNNALDIAEQPLTILKKLKDGSMSSKDVVHLDAMYPGIHARLNQKLTEQIADISNKGESIPYEIRQGLSLLMGQPLDSTMTPEAIQLVQASFQTMKPSEIQNAQMQNKQHKPALNSFKKLAVMDQSPTDRRLSRKD